MCAARSLKMFGELGAQKNGVPCSSRNPVRPRAQRALPWDTRMPVATSTPRATRTPRAPASARNAPKATSTPRTPSPTTSRPPRRTAKDARKVGQPPAPLAFGQYEMGRSSMPDNAEPTAAFRDTMKRGLVHPHPDGNNLQAPGDPGAYDPFTGNSVSARASFTLNKTNAPFGCHSARALYMEIYGKDNPGPGSYLHAAAKRHLQPAVDNNRSVFLSGSPQRPTDANAVPGPDVRSGLRTPCHLPPRCHGAHGHEALTIHPN